MPVVGDALMRQVEGGSGRISISAIKKADAIVVLSGMVEQVAGAPYGEWGEAAERFDGGVELYRAGKAPVVVFTGGQLPWQKQFVPEGKLLAKRAMMSGVPDSSIRISGEWSMGRCFAAQLGMEYGTLFCSSTCRVKTGIILLGDADP